MPAVIILYSTNLSVLHHESLPDPVDLLVDLGPVVVTLLSSPGHGALDSAGMPSSKTGNLENVIILCPHLSHHSQFYQ